MLDKDGQNVQKIASVLTVLWLFIATISVGGAISDNYWIKVKATPVGRYTVDVEIETNIPGSIVLAVSLALKGQKPQDTFIGTDFIRVPVVGGKAKVVIDGSKHALPYGSKLPAGNYNVEVSFYPHWPENRVAARESNISNTIEGKDSVILSASGRSLISAKAAVNGQRWVMEHFYANYPWKPEFW